MRTNHHSVTRPKLHPGHQWQPASLSAFSTEIVRHLGSLLDGKMSVEAQPVTQIQVENVVGKYIERLRRAEFNILSFSTNWLATSVKKLYSSGGLCTLPCSRRNNTHQFIESHPNFVFLLQRFPRQPSWSTT